MYLADQGADVVKIEPLWGDDARRVFTQPPMAGGESRAFIPLNRNKRGMAVNISLPEGRDIVYQLVDKADVFIHNFRPGVDQKLGYDYDLLRGRNPGLIYAAVSAFGTRGPYAHRRGYDLLFQALSGILNKRGMAVDISRPEGRDIVYQLVDRADVFIHNFRPGVDRKLGYDYDLLSGRNPGIIYAAVSAFGTRGPYAHRRGYDLLFQALSGILSKRRTADGTPIASGVWVADASMPIAIAYGVALALLVRHRTGRGQRVDASLLQMALAMQSVDMSGSSRKPLKRTGWTFRPRPFTRHTSAKTASFS